MSILDKLKLEISMEELNELSRHLSLTHKQVSMGVFCACSTWLVALILRMEKGLKLPETGAEQYESWRKSLLESQEMPVRNAIAAFSQTDPSQTAELMRFSAEKVQATLDAFLSPGQEDAFIQELYPQKERLMSTLPANVAAALDLARLQAGLAPDFGRGARMAWLIRLALLIGAGAMLIWSLRHC